MGNDRMDEKAKCPFYLRIVRQTGWSGIECESLDVNLGFTASHFLRLRNKADLKDYAELFCCDMYDTCPYYKAVMHARHGN